MNYYSKRINAFSPSLSLTALSLKSIPTPPKNKIQKDCSKCHSIDNRETFKMTHDSRSFVSFDKSQYTTNEHTYMM